MSCLGRGDHPVAGTCGEMVRTTAVGSLPVHPCQRPIRSGPLEGDDGEIRGNESEFRLTGQAAGVLEEHPPAAVSAKKVSHDPERAGDAPHSMPDIGGTASG